MIVKLMSSYIDSDGDVIALTREGCYVYKHKLEDPKKLLDKLAKADEINTEHWNKEWEFSSTGANQVKG